MRTPRDRERPAPPRRKPSTLSRPRMGKAATEAKLAEERSLVLSRHAVSRETVDRLDTYVALLRTWQARINLVSPATIPEIWTRHIEDGLVLAERAKGPLRWADLGSGAGLPGLVLAILLADRDRAEVHLVESNAKKAAFLRTVGRELNLPVTVHAERIEACGPTLRSVDAISARALASLNDLLAFVAPHMGPEAVCWFLKGRAHEVEIAEAAAHWRFDMVKHSSTVEDGSVLLEIRSPERRPAA